MFFFFFFLKKKKKDYLLLISNSKYFAGKIGEDIEKRRRFELKSLFASKFKE